MASVTQLGYLGIGVSDLARWEHFAANVLGLEVNGADADGSTFLRMDEYHHRFILQPGAPTTSRSSDGRSATRRRSTKSPRGCEPTAWRSRRRRRRKRARGAWSSI